MLTKIWRRLWGWWRRLPGDERAIDLPDTWPFRNLTATIVWTLVLAVAAWSAAAVLIWDTAVK